MKNLSRVLESMAAQKLPAAFISDIENVRWLTSFTGSFGYILITEKESVFISDSRYALQAREQVQGMTVVIYSTPQKVTDVIAAEMARLGVTQCGFEPSATYSVWEDWSKAWPTISLVSMGNLMPPLRMIKSPEEVAKIREACVLADKCFEHVQRMLVPGMVEYDISLDIEFFFRRHGATIAFDPIVASGPNSAKPHARPTQRKLVVGDFLTLDFGAGVGGYHSDITRTVVIGEASDRHRAIYGRVLESQVAAIEAMKPGANGKDVDKLVRDIMDKDDLSQYFGHGLGHA